MDLNVIIPAGGSGSRLGGEPKQYRVLGDAPILVQTARAFSRWRRTCRLWIVLPQGDRRRVAEMFGDWPGEVEFVDGGETRQASVLNGLRAVDAVSDPESLVFIHDAVRPFVEGELLDRVFEAARRSGAAAPAVAVVDTLRFVDGVWFGRTVERDGLHSMQTPQAFVVGRILAAHEWAVEEGMKATDDVELYIRFGGQVEWVDGAPENLKITNLGDLRVARDAWERST